MPYAAWRPVFAAMLGDPQPSAPSTQEQRLARIGPIRHLQLAPLINAVVPGFLEETPLVHSLSGQARADATSNLLSDIIAVHATARFILVLEDCHWMDSASWRLVLRVAQDYPQALVVLTSRPVTDVRELRALSALEGFAEMKLSPLRSSAIGSLVESVLGGQGVAEDVLDEITQRSVGNPLFAREYALLLTTRLHQGDFPSRPAAPQPAPSSLAVPVTVQSLIASRLDALSPSEDLALKAASVIGDSFNAGLLGGVYPGSPQSDALDAILANLTERQLIVRAEGDAGRFGFQHALIREVAYQQLTREQRIELHRRAAAAIEAEHHGDLRPHFAALAHHWSQAEEPAATITYSDRAASQALAAGAFEEADRLLSACIRRSDERALDNAADRIRWHRQMADARHGMGQLEPRSAAAHQALRIAGAPRPQTSVGLVVHSARLPRPVDGRAHHRRAAPG